MITQIYKVMRNVHLERIQGSKWPIEALYLRKSYDYDPVLAQQVGARRTNIFQVMFRVLKLRSGILEINEPLMLNSWPLIIPICFITRLKRFFSLPTPAIVSFCIENNDVRQRLDRFFRILGPMAAPFSRMIVRWLFNSYDHLSFGTQAAYQNYLRFSVLATSDVSFFPSLAPPCATCSLSKTKTLLFLGLLAKNKGVTDLLQVWPAVLEVVPDAKFIVCGKGQLRLEVESKIAMLESCTFVFDPSRAQIHELLSKAKVLCLPSKRTLGWREQVGLPILEGLSHGCEIVASDETGISDWLHENGHEIFATDNISDMTKAIIRALRKTERVHEILQSLPETEPRAEMIDYWVSKFMEK